MFIAPTELRYLKCMNHLYMYDQRCQFIHNYSFIFHQNVSYTFTINIPNIIPSAQSFRFSGNCLSNIKLLLTMVVCLYNGIFLLNKLVINIFINYYNLISIKYLSTIYNILLYKINKTTVGFNLKIFTNSVFKLLFKQRAIKYLFAFSWIISLWYKVNWNIFQSFCYKMFHKNNIFLSYKICTRHLFDRD